MVLLVFVNPKFNCKVQYLLFKSTIHQIVTLELTSPNTGGIGWFMIHPINRLHPLACMANAHYALCIKKGGNFHIRGGSPFMIVHTNKSVVYESSLHCAWISVDLQTR